MNTVATDSAHTDTTFWTIRHVIWMLMSIVVTLVLFMTYQDAMDVYEKAILIGAGIGFAWMGLAWKPLQSYFIAVALMSMASVALFQMGDNQIAYGEQNFFLKYLLSSQSAIMWMNALLLLATAMYWFALVRDHDFSYQFASRLTWVAVTFGFTGMLARWNESYLINPDYGHIPVSSLYEVFILFAVLTALLYLYYEAKFQNKSLGGFVLTVISAAVIFTLWYTFDKGAHVIQPLVPALKSYWMKIHVPANFVGYGTFALAAMVAVAWLVRHRIENRRPESVWLQRLPSLAMMEDLQYKAIGVGFVFFTIATILGAVWAAEAWGGYWSWDPKETWALIVWLNYAAWLHLRLNKNLAPHILAWWSLVGLLITTFAFIGVNMFLSGLHSYGEL